MEKIYRCEECNREFASAKECKAHEKTHKNPKDMLWRVIGDPRASKDYMVRVEPMPGRDLAHAEPTLVLAGSEDWWVNCLKPDILAALQSLNAVVQEHLREEEKALVQRRKDFGEAMGAMMKRYMNGGRQE